MRLTSIHKPNCCNRVYDCVVLSCDVQSEIIIIILFARTRKPMKRIASIFVLDTRLMFSQWSKCRGDIPQIIIITIQFYISCIQNKISALKYLYSLKPHPSISLKLFRSLHSASMAYLGSYYGGGDQYFASTNNSNITENELCHNSSIYIRFVYFVLFCTIFLTFFDSLQLPGHIFKSNFFFQIWCIIT